MSFDLAQPKRAFLKALDSLFIPARVAMLPVDERGYPVPWFVAKTATGWDFRVIGPGKLQAAVNKHLCWICGQRMGRHLAFVIGPMCAINRISAEPPSHLACAQFAAQACPFLNNPRMRRNEKDMPEHELPPGEMERGNPGVTLIWVTDSYRITKERLIKMGKLDRALWYAHGRPATPQEAEAGFDAGVERLRMVAMQDGPDALAELGKMTAEARSLLRVPGWR